MDFSDLANSHRTVLLESLKSFKTSDTFTDITLVVDGKQFRCHKLILASCSYFFEKMFTNGMIESRSDEINIHGVSLTGFKAILNYIYSGVIYIRPKNVIDILSAALYTQINPVVQECAEYLIQEINEENFSELAVIADTFSLSDLKTEVLDFITDNFLRIVNCNGFYKFTSEQIKHILSADVQIDITELRILEYILTWVFEGNYQLIHEKLNQLDDFLALIRFFEIVPSQLEVMLKNLFSTKIIDTRSNDICDKIIRISSQTKDVLRNISSKNTWNTRGMQFGMVKIPSLSTHKIEFYSFYEKKWVSLTFIPETNQWSFEAANINNELYVFGGYFRTRYRHAMRPFAYKYNLRSDTWVAIRATLEDRRNFTLTVVNDKIYAVGGSTKVGTSRAPELSATQSAECYDVNTNVWTPILPLPESRKRHACVAFSSTEHSLNWLFVSGGMNNCNTIVPDVFKYSLEDQCWSSCAPLPTSRAGHSMTVHENKIYVYGGWTENLDNPNPKVRVDVIEVYDVATDCWSYLTTISRNVRTMVRRTKNVVFLDFKIYFIPDVVGDVVIDFIDCFDITTDTWSEIETRDFPYEACIKGRLNVPKNRASSKIIK